MAIFPTRPANDSDLIIATNNSPSELIIADHHNLLKDEVIAVETFLPLTLGTTTAYGSSTVVVGIYPGLTKAVFYTELENKLVYVAFNISGVEGGTTVSFTVPYNAASPSENGRVNCINSALSDSPGTLSIATSSNVVTVTPASGVWTLGGGFPFDGRQVQGHFWYNRA